MKCKHCGLEIALDGNGTMDSWHHVEGPQNRLHRCAVNPYGYDAEPVGQPCSFACLGSKTGVGMVVS